MEKIAIVKTTLYQEWMDAHGPGKGRTPRRGGGASSTAKMSQQSAEITLGKLVKMIAPAATVKDKNGGLLITASTLLGLAIAVTPLVDRALRRRQLVPPWWMNLRVPLSLATILPLAMSSAEQLCPLIGVPQTQAQRGRFIALRQKT